MAERGSNWSSASHSLTIVALSASVVALVATFRSLALGQIHAAPSEAHWTCAILARPDPHRHYLADEDLHPPVPPVDGDDLLVLVDRSPRWRLSPNYVPSDLVEVHTLHPNTPAQCEDRFCLRAEAAAALHDMSDAMRRDGEEPSIDSAYRGYTLQCGVFHMWAYAERHGFCSATVASALPGHSQHQLGTAVDLFTRSWVQGGDKFREGFGCSAGGQWIASHSWVFGFVLPYPLHPDYRVGANECDARPEAIGRVDPRTGYKYEPWHVRYIGRENAALFHSAWIASGPGTASEITLEQWLRTRNAVTDPIEPPVCEGCACDSCATFHAPEDAGNDGPCARQALVLDRNGNPLVAPLRPSITDVSVSRDATGDILVHASVDVPENTLTQPPVINLSTSVHYGRGETSSRVTAFSGGIVHAYPSLEGAWRLAIGVRGVSRFDWHAALVDSARDASANGINSRIPATAGHLEVLVPIAGIAPHSVLRVALTHAAETTGERLVSVP